MAADNASPKTEDSKFSIPIPLVAGGIIVVLGLSAWGAYDYWQRKYPPAAPVLTAEAKQYVHNLQLSRVEMKAAESYMKQAVVEVTGKIGKPNHAIQFKITFPRTVQIFEGFLFTGDGKAITGSSKLQERETGFYALRLEQ